MSDVSLQTAVNIAEQYLNEVVRNPCDSPESDRWVITDNIYDRGNYWLFNYQSELYLKTGNPSYLLAGNLPLKVSKLTGDVLGFESACLEKRSETGAASD